MTLIDYDRFREQIPHLTEPQARALLLRLSEVRDRLAEATWEPYPWQVAPESVPTMGAWLMLGGRGTGKTEGAARYVDRHVRGPACAANLKGGHRVAIVAPSLGDAVTSCVEGPTGLRTINPAVVFRGGVGGHYLRWPNASQARLYGAYTPQDAERLRAGGNNCLVWLEEAAAMRYLGPAIEHTSLGLRAGSNPHFVISTTPKPRKEIKDLVADPLTVLTKGTTAEAYRLDPLVRQRLFERYAGTRLGRQELDAEILDDTEGALWNLTVIDAHRWSSWDREVPFADSRRPWRVAVGVDPPGETAECGIVVGAAPANGKAGQDHAVILDDLSLAGPPEVWGAQVVAAVRKWGAHAAYVEKNQGGDMVRSTIHNVDRSVRVEKLTATGTKYDRAEPISVLYPKGWIHHVGWFPELEDQMTTWVPSDEKSPDRVDALVHLLTALLAPMAPPLSTVGTPVGSRLYRVGSPDHLRR